MLSHNVKVMLIFPYIIKFLIRLKLVIKMHGVHFLADARQKVKYEHISIQSRALYFPVQTRCNNS